MSLLPCVSHAESWIHSAAAALWQDTEAASDRSEGGADLVVFDLPFPGAATSLLLQMMGQLRSVSQGIAPLCFSATSLDPRAHQVNQKRGLTFEVAPEPDARWIVVLDAEALRSGAVEPEKAA